MRSAPVLTATAPGAGGRRSGLDAELLWAGVGTALLICGSAVLVLMPALLEALPGCAFRGLTGLACPTCGGTRAALALAGGDLRRALALNPLLCLGMAAGGAYLVYAWGAVAGLLPRFRPGWLTPPMPGWMRTALFAAPVANWLYLILVNR